MSLVADGGIALMTLEGRDEAVGMPSALATLLMMADPSWEVLNCRN